MTSRLVIPPQARELQPDSAETADADRAGRAASPMVILLIAVGLFVAGVGAAGLAATLLGRDEDEPAAGPPAPLEADGDAGQDDAPAAAEEPAELPPDDLLTWAPPELEDPQRVEITPDNRFLDLDPDQDYELVLPDEPLEEPGGVTVSGGRNVVMIGGEIRIPADVDDNGRELRALYLQDQTGTVHVEGVAITGPGLGEGFNLSQREGGVVQLQNIYIETVQGTQEGHHADLVQSWAGPRQLRIDGMTGSTNYQGFFLLPQQFGDQPEPELFDLRRIDITGVEGSGYMLWRDDADWPVEVQDVWVSPQADSDDREAFLWPRDDEESWTDVQVGTPPDGPFVPEGLAGVGYRSPGYGGQG